MPKGHWHCGDPLVLSVSNNRQQYPDCQKFRGPEEHSLICPSASLIHARRSEPKEDTGEVRFGGSHSAGEISRRHRSGSTPRRPPITSPRRLRASVDFAWGQRGPSHTLEPCQVSDHQTRCRSRSRGRGIPQRSDVTPKSERCTVFDLGRGEDKRRRQRGGAGKTMAAGRATSHSCVKRAPKS